jgi:DNA processing protein
LAEPPTQIFIHGNIPRGPCVGIVGTRTPTPEARDYAAKLAFRLSKRGVAIASGGAEGIDAAAHQGALDAGGVTLVVAPSSFDHPYPEEHAELFATIVAEGGAYVSPFATGVKARQHHFFLRNSWLVALSHALIIVEAPLRSGARNAAKWARQLQRPCFIVPAPPWNPHGRGCIAELQLGGRALSSYKDVLRWLDERQLHGVPQGRYDEQDPSSSAPPMAPVRAGIAKQRARPTRREPEHLSPVERAILSAIRSGPCHADQIGRLVSLSAAEVSHAILLLTLQGLVAQGDAGEIRLAR